MIRYGIFSDVHSNLEALEAVLQALSAERVDRLLCAGDLVGYGADPVACLERMRGAGVQAVAGNHEWGALGKLPLDWFNEHAQRALEWTAGKLGPQERAYLSELPLTWKDAEVTLAHGSFHEPEKFHYVFEPGSAQECLTRLETPLGFIGHTHVPGFFVEEEPGQVRFSRSDWRELQPGRKLLVNVGSVGQPRDGDPRAAFCVYDTEQRRVEVKRVPYPVERAQRKIREAGLPGFLAERIAFGY